MTKWRILNRLKLGFKAVPIRADSQENGIYYPHWSALIPPRELWVGPADSVTHFLRWPMEYRAYLSILCGMQQDSQVLELGCNHGRTMLGLLDYLKPPGKYEGLDILASQIEFARKHIHARYSHFNFTYADIHNSLYNPNGQVKPASYRFPYDDATIDIIYAASLFTHLLPSSLVNYFRESRRVLKMGGRGLFSFFLLDHYNGRGTTVAPLYEFEHPVPHLTDGESTAAAVYSPDCPEQVIAYRQAFLERVANEAGFRIAGVLPGYWSKSQTFSVNEQDLIVLTAV